MRIVLQTPPCAPTGIAKAVRPVGGADGRGRQASAVCAYGFKQCFGMDSAGQHAPIDASNSQCRPSARIA